MAFVEICDFSYTYPGTSKPILNNINLSFNQGDFIVITGPSGCGKSTLGKAMAGFLFQNETRNHSGKILVNNSDMTEIPLYKAAEKVAYVQQNPEDQFCTLTVMDEIAFGLENLRYEPKEIQLRVDHALEIVNGLRLKDRKLSTLSGGEKQKIAIASLLALSPDVLILDEPTSNLDPIATRSIFDTLNEIRFIQGITVIIFEHKLGQLLPFDPILYEMKDSQIYFLEQQKKLNLIAKAQIDVATDRSIAVPGDKDAIIRFQDIDVSLGQSKILKDVSFSLFEGDFVALMGPNGSGKSTLMETMMNLHQIEFGTCYQFEYPEGQVKTSQLVKHIGFVFQNPDQQIFTDSVWDEVTFTCQNLGIFTEKIKDEAKEWLTKLGLDKRKEEHPQRLSYGEKRRLNLISAMLHKPKVLLIDEMLIGQDYQNAKTWMKIMQDYANLGNIVVLINHHPDLTQAFCNRILFLSEGKLIVDSPVPLAFSQLSEMGFEPFLPKTFEVAVNA